MPKINRDFNKVEYNNQYNKTNYFRVNLTLPKDFKAEFEEAVSKAGVSKNAYIKSAIMEKIKREK